MILRCLVFFLVYTLPGLRCFVVEKIADSLVEYSQCCPAQVGHFYLATRCRRESRYLCETFYYYSLFLTHSVEQSAR